MNLSIYDCYSLCREWEKNRRNKFNDAITKLGEVVREVSKCEPCKDTDAGKDNAKFAKIEIVQKAILCLTNFAQEKTQLSKFIGEVMDVIICNICQTII